MFAVMFLAAAALVIWKTVKLENERCTCDAYSCKGMLEAGEIDGEEIEGTGEGESSEESGE
jgi:hypothetical protein